MANTGTNRLRNMEIFVSSENLANVAITDITPTNTMQIHVLATPSLTQSADIQSISADETGPSPDRSEESFNTAVGPAEFEIQTYIRPTGQETASATLKSTPVADWVFWQQLTSNTVPLTAASIQSVFRTGGKLLTNTAAAAPGASATRSNYSEPSKLFMYWKVDGVYYKVSDAVINQCVIGADINDIATTTWSGFGLDKTQLTGEELNKFVAVFGGTNTSGATKLEANTSTLNLVAEATVLPWAQTNVAGTVTDADFIKTKYSTATITYKPNQSGTTESYNVGFTGFNFTYNNNMAPLTPAELKKLNKPIGMFTGTRQVTGNMTMLLKNSNTSTKQSAEFLRKVEEDQRTTIADTSSLSVSMGGVGNSNLVLDFDTCFFEFPNLEIDETIRVATNFRGQQSVANKANAAGGEVTATFHKA